MNNKKIDTVMGTPEGPEGPPASPNDREDRTRMTEYRRNLRTYRDKLLRKIASEEQKTGTEGRTRLNEIRKYQLANELNISLARASRKVAAENRMMSSSVRR